MTVDTTPGVGRLARDCGFTVIEVIVAMVILGTLLAISVPSIVNWRSSMDANQSARAITNTLMEARSRAISGNFQHKVEIDVAGKQYRMQTGNRAYDTQSGGWSTVPSYDYTTVSSGITVSSGADCSSSASVDVQFNANGTATLESPIGISIAGPVTVCVQGGAGAPAKKISISTAGRVSLD